MVNKRYGFQTLWFAFSRTIVDSRSIHRPDRESCGRTQAIASVGCCSRSLPTTLGEWPDLYDNKFAAILSYMGRKKKPAGELG